MSKLLAGGIAHLSEMQALVDELSETLQRSVAVENPRLELLCASAQLGAVDQWRIASIINRSSPPEPLSWMDTHVIATAVAPVRVPGDEEHGLLPRVCFPIRQAGTLLGYLWLFDEPPVAAAEMSEAAETVAALAPLLGSAEQTVRTRADDQQRLLVAATRSESALAAIHEAVALGFLPAHGRLLVHALRLRSPRKAQPSSPASNDLRLELARRQLGRSVLAGLDDDVLVTVFRGGTSRELRGFESFLRRVSTTAGYGLAGAGAAACELPADLEKATQRARFAADLCALRPDHKGFLRWEDLGSWRLLFGRPLCLETVAELSEDAQSLLARGTPEHWQTVVAYLDTGRSIAPTCQALRIHRATLYYRLDRIRELLGADALDDGWRAVSLHLALKLHRCLSQQGAGL